MKRKEAEVIIEIMKLADGGCSTCVAELIVQFMYVWPEYEDLAPDIVYWCEADETMGDNQRARIASEEGSCMK